MKVREIVTRVRAAVDELMANDSGFLLESKDEANLTAVIVDKIPYGLAYVIENAPLDKLDNDLAETESTAVTIAADLSATAKLPDDLLRIVSARLSSWSHSPIPEAEQSQVWLMQQDPYARGSWDRPATVVVHHGTERWLHLYSAKTASDTLQLSFIRKPKAISGISDATSEATLNTEVSVPTRLEAAFIYQIAGLSMVAFREDVAASLFSVARQYLGTAES